MSSSVHVGIVQVDTVAHILYWSVCQIESPVFMCVCVWYRRYMRPQSCKNKGRRLQQRIAADIVEAFPHLKADDAVSTSMGAGGEDIRLSTAAREAIPVSIECKCQEKLNVWSCLEQARANAPTGTTPCLVFSRNRCPTYAVVPWDVLLELYRRAFVHGEGGVPTHLSNALLALGPFVDTERSKRQRTQTETATEEDDEGESPE